MSGTTLTVSTVLSLVGLAIAFFYMKRVTSVPLDLGLEEEQGTRLKFIHGAIAKGAMAFLKQERWQATFQALPQRNQKCIQEPGDGVQIHTNP